MIIVKTVFDDEGNYVKICIMWKAEVEVGAVEVV